jgi:hypothetical protein
MFGMTLLLDKARGSQLFSLPLVPRSSNPTSRPQAASRLSAENLTACEQATKSGAVSYQQDTLNR